MGSHLGPMRTVSLSTNLNYSILLAQTVELKRIRTSYKRLRGAPPTVQIHLLKYGNRKTVAATLTETYNS